MSSPEDKVKKNGGIHRNKSESSVEYKREIVWRNAIIFALLHIGFLYGGYLYWTRAQWKTIFWSHLVGNSVMFGVTIGAHRLWTHRSFKAKLPLRIILAVLHTTAFQNDIHEWVRDHRVHHKYTDTNADPHNAKRGVFFSHIGWLMVRKHKDVIEKGKTIDMSDILADPVVRFQMKYYAILAALLAFILPAWVPWYFWNEELYIAIFVAVIYRYTLQLHVTWSVNSAAHIWGTRPYDKSLLPSENLGVSLLTLGEGWHNFHHVFPWDYKAAEFGTYGYNFNAILIEFMAKMGWAYDLKTTSEEMIKKRMARTGDWSFLNNPAQQNPEDIVWGWDEKNMKSDDMDFVKIQYRQQK